MSDDWIRPTKGFNKDTKQFQRKQEELSKCRYKCQCGHSVIIPYNVDTIICTWCRRRVSKDDKRFFRDKMRQMLNKKEG